MIDKNLLKLVIENLTKPHKTSHWNTKVVRNRHGELSKTQHARSYFGCQNLIKPHIRISKVEENRNATSPTSTRSRATARPQIEQTVSELIWFERQLSPKADIQITKK